ncbi:hypothetical protein [Conexibacter sp. CPCC 206217]|uniref:hypothetical protein n=1 Tax=Conexibacter sp. CPCC 206217 TaxID=3064574 RepID=UPI0027219C4F|nr:hypothetical protein [Conexibacter sp. CPCC 206217]MDO8213472.1 hypothetical protein [Conexibacter sp. CPCC 206217]
MPSASQPARYESRGEAAVGIPLLDNLAHCGAISRFQADWLAERWHDLPDDWASHPFMHTVRDYSRASIDQIRPRKEQP